MGTSLCCLAAALGPANGLRAALELGGKPLELFGDERIIRIGGGTAAVLGLAEQILLGGHGFQSRAYSSFFFLCCFVITVRAR